MSRLSPIALTAALCGLASCAPPVVLQQHADVSTRMHLVAQRFVADQQRGGMAGVTEDIEACYARATSPAVDVYTLRDCIVLDDVAYRHDMTVGRSFGMGSLPYFAPTVITQRWEKYGPMAQYQSLQEIAGYTRDANDLVQIDLAQMRR